MPVLVAHAHYRMGNDNPMKFKNLCALFLLSIASVYFICPVQCAAIQGAGEDTISDKVLGHHQRPVGSQTADEPSQSACCDANDQSASSNGSQEKGEGHCCFNRWESLGASEPQVFEQIQKGTFSLAELIPAALNISSASVSFTYYLQRFYKPHTDPPLPQLSPRAPPFTLT